MFERDDDDYASPQLEVRACEGILPKRFAIIAVLKPCSVRPKVFSPEGDCTIVRGQYQGRNTGTECWYESKRLRQLLELHPKTWDLSY